MGLLPHIFSLSVHIPLSVCMQDANARIPERSELTGTLDGDLRQMVQRQVEYYFSRENLMSDHYLSK